jgi:hypothetical protein
LEETCGFCGEAMEVTLRKVVYRKVVGIENVPVLTCPQCDKYRVIHQAKRDLLQLLKRLGGEPAATVLQFEKYCPFARILKALDEDPIKSREGARDQVNELLDLYLLAQSVHDEHWMKEIKRKLKAISL